MSNNLIQYLELRKQARECKNTLDIRLATSAAQLLWYKLTIEEQEIALEKLKNVSQ